MSKKQLSMDINIGMGDHLVLRIFMDGIKDQYERIAITHSKPGMQHWHNNDPKRWEFILELAQLTFSEPPYILVPNARFPFYPSEKIIKELNSKPVKPNLDHLCVGKSLNIDNYVVITTKIRALFKNDFEKIKSKLTPALQDLTKRYHVVIIGEREVERSREYNAECNRDQIFGIYNYLAEILPKDRTVDLTIPALGITCSNMAQFRQDCLITKQAKAAITFGIGGNLWMSFCLAQKTIGFRIDNEWATDLIHSALPNVFMTKDIDQFVNFLKSF